MQQTNTPLPLRLYTHNIRYATTHPFPHESPWPTRLPRVVSSITYTQHQHPSTLLCLQEVLHKQLLSILSLLPRSYSYIGHARDDGHEAGEYSPVIYDTAVWHLDQWRTKWLSQTPERPSKGWDAACIRILTVGYFTHRESGRQVVVLNTHLDDQGIIARRESARMIVEEVKKILGEGQGQGRGVVLAGDMNSPEGDDAYKIFTAPGSLLRDARADVPPEKRYGHQNTFSGFGNKNVVPQRIDFVFAAEEEGGRKASWTITNYSVLENKFDDEIYSSDHRPVVVDLFLS